VSQGKVEHYNLHKERLARHCQALHIVPPEINEEWISELILRNRASNGIWRLKIVITGGGDASLELPKRSHGHLLITLKPYEANPCQASRLTVCPFPIQRPQAGIKTLAYLDRLWVKDHATRNGFNDAIVTTPDGIVLETAFSNIFWRVGNTLFHPDPSLPLLQGISLEVLAKQTKEGGMLVEHAQTTVEELPKDAQIYLSNAMIGFVPVMCIDQCVFDRDRSFEERLKMMDLLR